jgi:hypothetical protein
VLSVTFFLVDLYIHSFTSYRLCRSFFGSPAQIQPGRTTSTLYFAAYFLKNNTETQINMFTPSLLLLLASAGLIEARSVHEARHLHALVHQRAAAGNGDASATTLSPNAIQSGSFTDGQLETGSDPGQSASQTSTNNFINNCAGKTLTNGLQITTGSCNGIRKYSYSSFNVCF